MSEHEATNCELDEFTAADRDGLRALQYREVRRTETPVYQVDDGTIVQGFEKRETYTFTADGVGTVIFDIRSIKDALLDGTIWARVYKMERTPEHLYQHVLNNNGVEPARLPKINGTDLERPGICVQWPDGHTSFIDGNHRLCRRYQLGMLSFRFFLIDLRDCLPFMCRPGDEKRLFRRNDPANAEELHTEIRMED